MGKIQIGSVTSNPQPQPGQKHRSSGNFSTQDIPNGTQHLQWEVSGPEANAIRFDVMKDVSAGIDPTEYDDVYNGKQTDVKEYRSLYIANPENATADFLVTVYALT